MSDEITLTLSRADAELLADLADTGVSYETRFLSSGSITPEFRAELAQVEDDGQRIIKSIHAALAALAADPAPEADDSPKDEQYAIVRTNMNVAFNLGAVYQRDQDRKWIGQLDDLVLTTQRRLRALAAPAEGPERAATEPTIQPSDELLAAMSRYVQLATERAGQPTYAANVRGGWMVVSALCGDDNRLLLWAHEMTQRRIRAVHEALRAAGEERGA
jgi:hypothetical protein